MLDIINLHPMVAALAAAHLVLFVVALINSLRDERLAIVTGWLAVCVLLFNTAIEINFWKESGRPPFKTLFETMVFYPWCVLIVSLGLVVIYRLWLMLPFASAISMVGLCYAMAKPDLEFVDLPPALQSAWFVPHVVTYFISYSALFCSCALAGLSLYKREDGRKEISSPHATHAHRAAAFGIAALTLGLGMGAAWGKQAWGDYWSWDPKENWALITWLAYLAYLHMRRVDAWKGRASMWLLVIAFGIVAFTYLGVHLLASASGSLHVYQ